MVFHDDTDIASIVGITIDTLNGATAQISRSDKTITEAQRAHLEQAIQQLRRALKFKKIADRNVQKGRPAEVSHTLPDSED